jgi:hypothetical protein
MMRRLKVLRKQPTCLRLNRPGASGTDRWLEKERLAARAAPAAGPAIVETVTRVCPAIIELRTAVAKALKS